MTPCPMVLTYKAGVGDEAVAVVLVLAAAGGEFGGLAVVLELSPARPEGTTTIPNPSPSQPHTRYYTLYTHYTHTHIYTHTHKHTHTETLTCTLTREQQRLYLCVGSPLKGYHRSGDHSTMQSLHLKE